MGTHMVRGWIVGILAALSLLVVVSPAQAHAELESSDPADGATLASAPATITFTFGEEILPEGNAVTLTDVAAASRLEVGPVEVDGDTVTVAWPTSSPAGEFRAAYRVVSADGHPIDGTITFVVQEAVGAGGVASPATSAGPDASASASAASPEATSDPEPEAVSATPAPGEDDADAGELVWALGIGLVVLVGAGVSAWVMRRTR